LKDNLVLKSEGSNHEAIYQAFPFHWIKNWPATLLPKTLIVQ
jgi:hypothetical protein